ncbi:MAG: hypothetical protein K2X86_07055, partial [Cytophagaceae bacterium]|nr:hypothetical protein [Cytophagaceae bacterium]
MKRVLLVFFFISAFSFEGMCDTIDVWHVLYNGKTLKELNLYHQGYEIRLKASEIKKGDSITIKYSRDTPCSDCSTNLLIRDDNSVQLALIHGKGT